MFYLFVYECGVERGGMNDFDAAYDELSDAVHRVANIDYRGGYDAEIAVIHNDDLVEIAYYGGKQWIRHDNADSLSGNIRALIDSRFEE